MVIKKDLVSVNSPWKQNINGEGSNINLTHKSTGLFAYEEEFILTYVIGQQKRYISQG